MKNTLLEYGYTQNQIDQRVNQVFYDIFEGPSRFYFDGLRDTSYFMDTGNIDARTEGISYAMMMCVQLDKKEYFDRIWKFAVEFMYMEEGPYKGYFAWSVAPDGKKNAFGPAPDGEEFFAMSLFLAGKRWGNGEGIYNYTEWAKKILRTCLHHPLPMWNQENGYILFVPASPHTDASYHLMHFYHYFALWADECDRPFWKKAEEASRQYLTTACNPKTGMSPEYGNFDGTPNPYGPPENHGDFYSDAYRTGANIGLDYLWHADSKETRSEYHKDFSKIADNLVSFFADIPTKEFKKYKIDGTVVKDEDGNPEKALHPVGLLSSLAQTTLACSKSNPDAKKIIDRFWNTPLRSDERRYYDNCLYMFAILALSGNYKVFIS